MFLHANKVWYFESYITEIENSLPSQWISSIPIQLRWDVIVRLVDIGGIVDHHFKLSFHKLLYIIRRSSILFLLASLRKSIKFWHQWTFNIVFNIISCKNLRRSFLLVFAHKK